MTVAIDGPAGCGKSTVAKELSKRLGFYYLNTGSFYRALTYACIRDGVDLSDSDKILEKAKECEFGVDSGDLLLGNENVENKLHGPDIDLNASRVSTDPRVREIITAEVRRLVGKMDVVTEGRDTTTVIFPDAECKFYFDAEPEVRARRRMCQIKSGETFEQVLKKIEERDEIDKNKKVGALKAAKDAFYIDTSHLTISEVCEKVVSVMHFKV